MPVIACTISLRLYRLAMPAISIGLPSTKRGGSSSAIPARVLRYACRGNGVSKRLQVSRKRLHILLCQSAGPSIHDVRTPEFLLERPELRAYIRRSLAR